VSVPGTHYLRLELRMWMSWGRVMSPGFERVLALALIASNLGCIVSTRLYRVKPAVRAERAGNSRSKGARGVLTEFYRSKQTQSDSVATLYHVIDPFPPSQGSELPVPLATFPPDSLTSRVSPLATPDPA
jgi:hypothetical protein